MNNSLPSVGPTELTWINSADLYSSCIAFVILSVVSEPSSINSVLIEMIDLMLLFSAVGLTFKIWIYGFLIPILSKSVLVFATSSLLTVSGTPYCRIVPPV